MRVSASQVVRAPMARTFEIFTDVEHCAGRIKGVKRAQLLSEMRQGVGVRWRETRDFFGKDADADKEITAMDAPRSFHVESRVDGTLYLSAFEFAEGPQPGSTVVTWTHTSRAMTLGAKLMSPLLFLMQGTMAKYMKKDLADLAEFLAQPPS